MYTYKYIYIYIRSASIRRSSWTRERRRRRWRWATSSPSWPPASATSASTRTRAPRAPCYATRVSRTATAWPIQDILLLRGFCARFNHLSFPAPTCIGHPDAILLHDYWAVYDPPSGLPCVCHTPYNIGNSLL